MESVRVAALLLVAIVIPACDSPSVEPVQPPTGGGGGGGGGTGTTTFKAAMLSGRQEVPPEVSSGVGDATLAIDATRTFIQVTVNFSGLTNLTAAHIHVGAIGADGPIIFPLASGSFTNPLVVTLTEAAFTPQPGAGIATFSQAITAIQEGQTYVNLHTATFPDGEIRGQVGPVQVVAQLNGLQEVPPVVTTATGSMTLLTSSDQSSMTFTLAFSNLDNITGGHLHVGEVGLDGPILFPFADAAFASPLSVTLTAADLTPQPAGGVTSFAEVVDAMISGRMYANIHTTMNPDGEIRGQLLGSPITVPPPPTKTSR